MDCKKDILDYIDREIAVLRALDVDALEAVVRALADAFEREATVYIFGNGGSAATASHFAGDFNKGISEFTEKKFRFQCLSDNVPTLLAVANDIAFEEIYRFQLRGRLRPGDLVMGISGSGNSPDIVNALAYAREIGARTVALTGYDGGQADALADLHLHVPVHNMQITEDIHMIFDHLFMTVLMQAWGLRQHE